VKEGKRLHIIDGFRQSPPLGRRHQFGQGEGPRHSSESNRFPKLTAPAGGQLTVALKATEKRLSGLLEDRARISRDLHDSVLQSLYAIGLSLETSHRISALPRSGANRAYSHAVDQLNRLIHEVRGIIKGLADGSVQDMNLSEELRQLAGSYEQLSSVTITLSLQPSALDVLTREEEQEILNIVREALSNCVRHAQATHAEVTIRTQSNRVRISISDDGKGFVETGAHPKGYGLMNMEARAKKLGGSLLLRSKPGQGTRITAEFLLEPILTPI
jgi:signal transduction histidine kinase